MTKEIEKLAAAICSSDSVDELAKLVDQKSKRRQVVAEALAGLESLMKDTVLNGLEEKVRAELSSVRLVLEGADPHALRTELQKHIESINVDIKGLITIKGSLSGALKSVLKLVAGARYTPQRRFWAWSCLSPVNARKSATKAALAG
ncbi:MAG: hypothetical protein ACYTDT_02290 [Planctomycetota bacterium]